MVARESFCQCNLIMGAHHSLHSLIYFLLFVLLSVPQLAILPYPFHSLSTVFLIVVTGSQDRRRICQPLLTRAHTHTEVVNLKYEANTVKDHICVSYNNGNYQVGHQQHNNQHKYNINNSYFYHSTYNILIFTSPPPK